MRGRSTAKGILKIAHYLWVECTQSDVCLSKFVVNMQSPGIINSPIKTSKQNEAIDTGILNWNDSGAALESAKPAKAEELFGGEMDWGQPVAREEDKLELEWGDDGIGTDEDEDEGIQIKSKVPEKISSKHNSVSKNEDDDDNKSEGEEKLDIMAQQLKFVACLKILMEELSTLATGYEVDGGQLRYQLYMWLEREVDALRQLCNYSPAADLPDPHYETVEAAQDVRSCDTPTLSKEKPTLHEILMAEKSEFEAKVQRAARRKRWLKANETLLRTLLSYCSLHGASGGGLASVRMELVLLLQELQQEKTQQQLLSPLPFPTTLPLLSASVAGNKTVIADPVRHLQSLAHDMLQTIVELGGPPTLNCVNFSEVFVLRDLAVALSACIYQSLCDSDTCSTKLCVDSNADNLQGQNLDTLAFVSSHLIATQQRKRRYSTDEPLQVSTQPSKWPGVTNLRSLLAREKDEDTPRLNILLTESFVATFMSLTVYAFATCDCHILYRIVGQNFADRTWGTLFGGGVKKLLRVAQTSGGGCNPGVINRSDSDGGGSESGVWTTMTSITKQRIRMNMKLLGQFGQQPGGTNIKEDKPTYREQFLPPEMSMISHFLSKPILIDEAAELDYDSGGSEKSDSESEGEDVFDSGERIDKTDTRKDNNEHSNPNSYSWAVMRLAIIRVLRGQLQEFIAVAGIEVQELPVCSPLIHGVLRIVGRWEENLKKELESRGPPPSNYIPGCYVDSVTFPGPSIHKYRSIFEKSNTPFHPGSWSAAPARRLWSYLVRQEAVTDLFVKCVFGKRPHSRSGDSRSDEGMAVQPTSHPPVAEPVRIIHKDQDQISAFCLNQVNGGQLALATTREVQEMDITLLLNMPSWLEDECEFDLIDYPKNEIEVNLGASSFLVIQTPQDKMQSIPNPSGSSPQPGVAVQSGRGTSMGGHRDASGNGHHKPSSVLRHRVDGIRKMSSHPLLPLYLTGSQDGSVAMWEWGHNAAVTVPRAGGTFAKVTRVRFSQHGNKFGVADGDGNLSLFQVGITSATNRPFFTCQCHNKVTSDFVFLGSCSMVATAGHSSESKNVALWDTLLPQRKSLIVAWTCHEQGASSLVFAPQHQLLISAGKKGDVCIMDVRSRGLRQRFTAHESAIKCLAIDPAEEFFATGASDGDIKVWSLTLHQVLYNFPGEHAKSSFFKPIGQGVTQLYLDGGARLFSCGADGSMKVRQLPEEREHHL